MESLIFHLDLFNLCVDHFLKRSDKYCRMKLAAHKKPHKKQWLSNQWSKWHQIGYFEKQLFTLPLSFYLCSWQKLLFYATSIVISFDAVSATLSFVEVILAIASVSCMVVTDAKQCTYLTQSVVNRFVNRAFLLRILK